MKNATKTHISPVDTLTPPKAVPRSSGLLEASHGLQRALGDYRRMKPVKIVPDDDSTVYIYLAAGIAIGFIVGVSI